MNIKEQTPLYIVGIVAVVAIVVLVLAIQANTSGKAFDFQTVQAPGPANILPLLAQLGFTIDENGNLVGDCDNPKITELAGGPVTCDPSSQTAVLPGGKTVRFGGFNQPRVYNKICWLNLPQETKNCVTSQLGLPIPSNANFCVNTVVDPNVCASYNVATPQGCADCAAAIGSQLLSNPSFQPVK